MRRRRENRAARCARRLLRGPGVTFASSDLAGFDLYLRASADLHDGYGLREHAAAVPGSVVLEVPALLVIVPKGGRR